MRAAAFGSSNESRSHRSVSGRRGARRAVRAARGTPRKARTEPPQHATHPPSVEMESASGGVSGRASRPGWGTPIPSAVIMHIPDGELFDVALELRERLAEGGKLLISMSHEEI